MDNTVAIDLITKHVQIQLNDRGVDLRSALSNNDVHEVSSLVSLISQTPRVLHVIGELKNPQTKQDDFVKHADSLSLVVVQEALRLAGVPFEAEIRLGSKEVNYTVSIVRGGLPLVKAIQREIPAILSGNVSISTSAQEPQLTSYHLPEIGLLAKNGVVLLMDDQISTGATALMAIRIILDHRIEQENIIFCTLVATALGLSNIYRAFPKVKIVIATVVDYNRENPELIDGFGAFSNRYFENSA